MTTHVFTCGACKVTKTHTSDMTTGYGIEPGTEAKICFECCGKRDLGAMLTDGKATLYLTSKDAPAGHRYFEVTNWPGTLVRPVTSYSIGRHNMARRRYDVWFVVPGDAFIWHGVTIGDMTQICHCKRTKTGMG